MSSVTKVIKFYQFEPQPSFANNGITPMSTNEVLQAVFSINGSYSVNFEKETYTIDILDMNGNYVFGKCAKENELPITTFLQTRNKHTNKTEPYSSLSPDTQLEVYTFFFIDCQKNRMSALQHKSITKIQHVLSAAIWQLSQNTLKIFCAPERIKDIKHTAKKLKRNKKLAVSFAPNAASTYNIDTLTAALGGIQYDSFSIEIKLSQSTTDAEVNSIYDNYQNSKESFNSLKLIGKTDNGIEETVDFIETLFTHSTSFEITEDIVKNYDIIKKKLSEALLIEQ